MSLTPSVARLPSTSVISIPVLHSGRLVRKVVYGSESRRAKLRVGRNVYDVSKVEYTVMAQPSVSLITAKPQPCKGHLCYEETDVIASYLNRPDVRELLGVESPFDFSSCSYSVSAGFTSHMDRFKVPTQLYVGGLLEVKSSS